jgi:hypothetical protein
VEHHQLGFPGTLSGSVEQDLSPFVVTFPWPVAFPAVVAIRWPVILAIFWPIVVKHGSLSRVAMRFFYGNGMRSPMPLENSTSTV